MPLWNDEKVALLRKLWQQPLSSDQIAKRIGDGVNRGSVIAKAHRMKLGPKKYPFDPLMKTIKRTAYTRQMMFSACTPSGSLPPQPLPLKHPGDVARVSFADLDERNHCKFVAVSDPNNQGIRATRKIYCGLQRVEGLPYCAEHAQRCMPGSVPPPVKSQAVRVQRSASPEDTELELVS